MKLCILLLIATSLIAAPKKKAPVVTNDEDFVPLKKVEKKPVTPTPSPEQVVKGVPTPTVLPTPPEAQTAEEKKPEVESKKTEEATPGTPEISEVLIAKSYLQVIDLEALPKDLIQWEDRSGKSLYIPKTGDPYILLMGRIKDSNSLSINDAAVPLRNGNFEFKLTLPAEPAPLSFKITKPDGKTETYRQSLVWIKSPGSIRVKVKEDETGNVQDKSIGFSGQVKLSALVELTSEEIPTNQVDTFLHKKQDLEFKITAPVSNEKLESWKLVVKDIKKDIVAEKQKKGSPPSYVSWNSFMPDILPVGKYTYRVSLFTKTGVFDGPVGRFEVSEGKITLTKSQSTQIALEPREEIGYLTFKNNNSYGTSSLYVGTELPVLISNRFLIKPGGMLALPTADPDNTYYSARALVGMRFKSQGNRLLLLKVPYQMQLDVLLGLSRFSLSRRSPNPDFNHLTLSLQPELVLWGEQYVTPVFEYSASTSFKSMRLSVGMVYQFYIKAWSMKWGMGFAMDSLFQDEIAANKYSLFRALSSFQFQL